MESFKIGDMVMINDFDMWGKIVMIKSAPPHLIDIMGGDPNMEDTCLYTVEIGENSFISTLSNCLNHIKPERVSE